MLITTAVRNVLAFSSLLTCCTEVNAAALHPQPLSSQNNALQSQLQQRDLIDTTSKGNATFEKAPQEISIHLQGTNVIVLIVPSADFKRPMLPESEVGQLLRSFGAEVEEQIAIHGLDEEARLKDYRVRYMNFRIVVSSIQRPGQSRNLLWRDIKDLITVLTLNFHRVDDWPSCIYLADSNSPPAGRNTIGSVLIGPMDYFTCDDPVETWQQSVAVGSLDTS